MSELIEKLWGDEQVLHNGTYCMKILTLNPGFQSSLHFHQEKEETFLVVKGVCDMEVGDNPIRRMMMGEYVQLHPFVPHRFRAVNDVCVIVEASTHHDDKDVVRLEKSRRIDGETTDPSPVVSNNNPFRLHTDRKDGL